MTRKAEWPKNVDIAKTTLALPRKLIEAGKILAIKERRTLQEVVADALEMYLRDVKKGGRDAR